MTSFQIAPLVSALALLVVASLIGIVPVKKLIQIAEAKHELRQGSAGRLRTVGGWSIIAFWLLITLYLGTILGDWLVTGDPGGAVDRSMIRLRILLEILSAIADSDS